MGAVLTLGDAVGVVQSWHYGSRQDSWARLSYELDHQGMRLDLLNSVREEIRDQVTVIISSLDNLMVVATLMLSIGFGLVGESSDSVPRVDPEDGMWQISLREAYSVLSALTLVFPFWCLMFTLRMRYEVDQCLGKHMEDLQGQLCNVLRRRQIQPPASRRREGSRTLRVGSSMPSRKRSWNRLSSRMGKLGSLNFREEEIKDVEEYQIVLWAKEDLLQKLNCYHFYYPLAQIFLWLGMLSVLLTCSVVQGLHFREHFIDEPWMWWSYSSIVTVSGLLSMIFMAWMLFIGTLTSGPRVRALSSAHSEPGTPVPDLHDVRGLEPEEPTRGGSYYGSTSDASTRLCQSNLESGPSESDLEQPPAPANAPSVRFGRLPVGRR